MAKPVMRWRSGRGSVDAEGSENACRGRGSGFVMQSAIGSSRLLWRIQRAALHSRAPQGSPPAARFWTISGQPLAVAFTRFHQLTGDIMKTTDSRLVFPLRAALGVALIFWAFAGVHEVSANPKIRQAFFSVYPSAVGTQLDSLPSKSGHCGACHWDFNGGGSRNPYGVSIQNIIKSFPNSEAMPCTRCATWIRMWTPSRARSKSPT
jgi:hypothetical protein